MNVTARLGRALIGGAGIEWKGEDLVVTDRRSEAGDGWMHRLAMRGRRGIDGKCVSPKCVVRPDRYRLVRQCDSQPIEAWNSRNGIVLPVHVSDCQCRAVRVHAVRIGISRSGSAETGVAGLEPSELGAGVQAWLVSHRWDRRGFDRMFADWSGRL